MELSSLPSLCVTLMTLGGKNAIWRGVVEVARSLILALAVVMSLATMNVGEAQARGRTTTDALKLSIKHILNYAHRRGIPAPTASAYCPYRNVISWSCRGKVYLDRRVWRYDGVIVLVLVGTRTTGPAHFWRVQ